MEQKLTEWKEKLDKKQVIRILLLAAVCVAVCLTTRGASEGLLFFFDTSSEDGSMAGMSEREKLKLMQQTVDESAFSFRINGNMSFETGDSRGVLFIENPAGNDCLLKVTITLDDDGRVLYETGYLEPGTGVGKDKLDVALPAGEYEATADLVSCNSDKKEIGRAQAGIHITIRK